MTNQLMHREELYIGGAWEASSGGERLDVVSPSTEEVVGDVSLASAADMDRAVTAARAAFDDGPWPRMSPAERADVLSRVSAGLSKRQAETVDVIVDEMGCAISSAAFGQMGLVGPVFDYYAGYIRDFAFERTVPAGDRYGLVTNEPVGVVGAIIPWNSPLTLSAWKLAPALAAGCTVIVKPAPEAPLSNYILAEVLEEAGVPAGVVSVLPAGREVGEHLVQHPGVDKIAFTGSSAAGKKIMAACGEQIKRVSLELGGKSAAIVLDDADIADVIGKLVHGAMHLSGQVCGAHTRVLVHRSQYAAAVEAAAAVAGQITVGDPHDPATEVGPLVAERQRTRVLGYISLGVEAGARIAAGGGRPPELDRGWYVQPTILADVDNSMRVAREEIFGPVLSFIPFGDDDEAVRIANDSVYGLAGGVWSGDDGHAMTVAKRMRTGTISVNGYFPPFPAVPFGGFRESGLGRELGPEGLSSFLEARSIGLPPSLLS